MLAALNEFTCSVPVSGAVSGAKADSAFSFDAVPELANATTAASKNACVLKPASYNDSIAGKGLINCTTQGMKANVASVAKKNGIPVKVAEVIKSASVQYVRGQKACMLELTPDLSSTQYADFQAVMRDVSIRGSDVYMDLERLKAAADLNLSNLTKQSLELQQAIDKEDAAITVLTTQNASL